MCFGNGPDPDPAPPASSRSYSGLSGFFSLLGLPITANAILSLAGITNVSLHVLQHRPLLTGWALCPYLQSHISLHIEHFISLSHFLFTCIFKRGSRVIPYRQVMEPHPQNFLKKVAEFCFLKNLCPVNAHEPGVERFQILRPLKRNEEMLGQNWSPLRPFWSRYRARSFSGQVRTNSTHRRA